MLKYIKQYAASIQGIDIYPIISMSIFVLFFIAVIYYVTKMNKQKVEQLRSLPLDLVDEPKELVNNVKQA